MQDLILASSVRKSGGQPRPVDYDGWPPGENGRLGSGLGGDLGGGFDRLTFENLRHRHQVCDFIFLDNNISI